MLLTKLEAKGFKSFGDRVVFHFDKGITAVVGPNGSGKSNVVDAIRWVLGEQRTKALRSDKMDNIIFNGTKKRKQLQMAEVSLTFKNTRNLLPTEYTEVTIGRRYYRSGEGEYLLNGVNCRLKDIQSLFMDTGIGPDSYAIIELKMVDDILTDQNNSRRGLFEQAAGISKFKQRRKETMRKLEETDADLARVEDLLFEIAKNLRSLERQAKQAERYLKLKADYKSLSLSLAKKSMAAELEKAERQQDQLQAMEAERAAIVAAMAETDAQLQKEKADIVTKEQTLASRQKALNAQTGKIRQYESEKKIKSERLRMLTAKVQSLGKQVEEERKSNSRAKYSIESLQAETTSVEKLLAETSYLLDRYKSALEAQRAKVSATKERVGEMGQQAKNQQNAVYNLRKGLEINQVQRNALRQELERESTDTSEKSANLEEFDQKLKSLAAEKAAQEAQLRQLEERQRATEGQLQAATKALQSLKDEHGKASRLADAKENEYNLTKSMLDNLEGYPAAIKFLKKNTPWGNKAPLLSDIITTDEKYRVAIENFLEPYLNFYVLENESQAWQAVNLLSDAAKGKGNFLLLDKFRSHSPKGHRQFEDAVPAIEIVEYDDKYKYLFAYLLEDVYVVVRNQDDLPKDESVTFVTQNGKVIRRRYMLSGGSIGLFEGKKIGRAKNLEKLSTELRVLEKRMAEFDKLIADRAHEIRGLEESSVKEELQDASRQMGQLEQAYVAVRTKKEQFDAMLATSADKREVLSEQQLQLDEQIAAAGPKLVEAEETLRDREADYEDLRQQLDQETEEMSQHSADYNQQNITFHQQENQLRSLEKEIDYKQSAYEKGVARLALNEQELKNTEQEIRAVESESDVDEQELVDMYEEKNAIEEAVNEAEKAYYQARGQISEQEKTLREKQQNKDQADQLLQQIKDEINALQMRMASAKERASVEFNADLARVEIPEEHLNFSADFLAEEVAKTKDKLEKMGAINHMAIEAYEEMKERHDFINEQKEDLEKAKASLIETIDAIDQVAKENFMTAFHQIRDNFVEVFRSLFTEEDSCDLKLTDETDPLNAKIEIIAQPKGKKPLSISQLSGGEKTLTATALLFSIYLLKPAPFCIFDEVDAPLDDANIDKFNNIIKKFSERSQFIVVTHNKRTMASTDVIYGVTMVEQGVTTVVPVDLREIAND